jgi:hypothetical protein
MMYIAVFIFSFSSDSLDPVARSSRIDAISSKLTQSHSRFLFWRQFGMIQPLDLLFIHPTQYERESFEFHIALSQSLCRLGPPSIALASIILHDKAASDLCLQLMETRQRPVCQIRVSWRLNLLLRALLATTHRSSRSVRGSSSSANRHARCTPRGGPGSREICWNGMDRNA